MMKDFTVTTSTGANGNFSANCFNNNNHSQPTMKPQQQELQQQQLQQLQQQSQLFNTLKMFQISAFLLHTYAYFYLFFLRQHNYDYGYGGQFKFFTVWTHTINVMFYTFSVFQLLSDNWKSWLFKLSFVSSVCVSIMFWGVQILIDPNAFQLDPRNYPAWLNHAQHTAPSIIALIELSLFHYAYHGLLMEMLVIFSYAFLYFSFALRAKFVSGRYPYPFMDSFPDVRTFLWFSVITSMIAVLVHVIGRILSTVVHRHHLQQQHHRHHHHHNMEERSSLTSSHTVTTSTNVSHEDDDQPSSNTTTTTTTRSVTTTANSILTSSEDNIISCEPSSSSILPTVVKKKGGLLAKMRHRHRILVDSTQLHHRRQQNDENNSNNTNNGGGGTRREQENRGKEKRNSPLFLSSPVFSK